MPLFVVAFVLCMTILAVHPASACETEGKTFYLDPAGGSDANDCHAEATACQSAARLRTQLGALAPGTTILLKRGTTLRVTSKLAMVGASGTADQPIVIGAYGDPDAPRPVIDGTAMGGGVMVFECKEVAHWTLQDLHIKGNKGAVMWLGCTHQVLQRVEISACQQECLHAKWASPTVFASHITIRDVLITAPQRDEGIYIGTDPEQSGGAYDQTSDILIDQVTIRGGASHECVEMKQGSQRVTIQHSRFEDMTLTQNGCIFSSRRDAAAPPGHHVITHNVLQRLQGSQAYGIRVRNDATIEANTISETAQAGLYLESLSEYPVFKRTVVSQGTSP